MEGHLRLVPDVARGADQEGSETAFEEGFAGREVPAYPFDGGRD